MIVIEQGVYGYSLKTVEGKRVSSSIQILIPTKQHLSIDIPKSQWTNSVELHLEGNIPIIISKYGFFSFFSNKSLINPTIANNWHKNLGKAKV